VNKWELVEEMKPMVQRGVDLWKNRVFMQRVFVDVYRKKRWNGLYKFKMVVRFKSVEASI